MNQFYGPSKLDKSFAMKASSNTATAVVLDTLDLAVSHQPTGTKAVDCGKSGRWMDVSLLPPTRQITFSTNMGKSSVAMPIRKSAKGRSSAGFWVSTDDTAKTKHVLSPLVWPSVVNVKKEMIKLMSILEAFKKQTKVINYFVNQFLISLTSSLLLNFNLALEEYWSWCASLSQTTFNSLVNRYPGITREELSPYFTLSKPEAELPALFKARCTSNLVKGVEKRSRKSPSHIMMTHFYDQKFDRKTFF
uniref:Uncharacterized protein n=1 Tax=Romanomermis culicivorax TaxID=13658 RepID=A0A915IIR9_ROMCU